MGTARQFPQFSAIVPIGLDREAAAAYVCAGTTLFDDMVKDGRMPAPRIMNSRRVWDREELYQAFKALPHKGEDTQSTPNEGVDWSKMK